MENIPIDLEMEDFLTTPQTVFDISKRLKAIERLEREIDDFMVLKDEADAFYLGKIAKLRDRIEEIKGYVKAYIEASDRQTIVTHNGTAFISRTTKYEWPDDKTLLAFAKRECPDAIVTNELVSKLKLKEWIKQNGKLPDGVSVTEVTGLNIRDPGRRKGAINPGQAGFDEEQ